MFSGVIRIVVGRCISICRFSVNYFKALVGSVDDKVLKVDEGFSFKCKFEL